MSKKPTVSPAERVDWLERWERGNRVDRIARESGRNPRTVKIHIDQARIERELEEARRDQLREALHRHQQDLLGLVDRLRETVLTPVLPDSTEGLSFSPAALLGMPDLMSEDKLDLGASTAAGDVASLGPEGQPELHAVRVEVENGDPQSVRLREEDSRLWSALRQHLGLRDHLWRDLSEWRGALLSELMASAALNSWIRQQAEATFSLQVRLTSEPGEGRLTSALVAFVRLEATRRALGEQAADVEERVVLADHRLEDPRTNATLAEGLPGEADGIQKLGRLVDAVSASDEAKLAAEAQRDARIHAVRIGQDLEEYVLLHHIRGWCRLCRKLGV